MRRGFRYLGLVLALTGVAAWAGLSWHGQGNASLFVLHPKKYTSFGIEKDITPSINMLRGTLREKLHHYAGMSSIYRAFNFHVVEVFDLFKSNNLVFDAFHRALYRVVPLYAEGDYYDHWRFAAYIDRFNATFSLAPSVRVVVGRQAIAFGKDFFWSPLDVYRPFSPASVDRDYKSGTDALRLDVGLGPVSGLNVILVPGPTKAQGRLTWFGSSGTMRIYGNALGFDLSAMGGTIYGAGYVGGGISGDVLGGVELRGEGMAVWSKDRNISKFSRAFQFVLGTGYRWPNTFYVQAEYYHNSLGLHSFGDASPEDLVRVRYLVGRTLIPNYSRDLLGISASYAFIPILTGRLSSIYSINSSSAMLQADIAYNALDNLDILVLASAGLGKKTRKLGLLVVPLGSEFGPAPYTVLLQAKFYW